MVYEMELTTKEKWKRAFTIFHIMFKVGLFTWGGGWSIIAQLQREFIEKRKWTTQDELMDIISVGRSLPGIMVMNISVLFGYHVGGIPCLFASLLGIASPSVILMCFVTGFYTKIKDNVYVAKALVGVRASVIPIIGLSALKMRKAAFVDKLTYFFAIAALLFCFFVNIHNIFIVILGAIGGLMMGEVKRRGSLH